jgi:nucleotide-binding universal stress UspA family protein
MERQGGGDARTVRRFDVTRSDEEFSMYTRVLVPLDGSTIALQVLPYAKVVAKSTGARIVLLQALTTYPRELTARMSADIVMDSSVFPPAADTWSNLQASAAAEADKRFTEAANRLRGEGFTVDTITVEADPADAIVAEAEKDPNTLIAISTYGPSGIGRWLMGSVTDKVVRQALNPVLIVRARDDEVTSAAPKLARVVLPLDGSDKSHLATAHAVEMAKDLGVGITLLRFISPMAYGDTLADYVPTMYDDLAGEVESDVRDFLVHGAEGLRAQGVTDVAQKAVDGYAAPAFLDEVGDDGDSLVVMATRGRAGIGRWVLASVSDRVVRHSTGAVLVVRPAH